MSRITDRNDWFELWCSNKKSILTTMMKNMEADLEAGYDFYSTSLTTARRERAIYKKEYEDDLDLFKTMTNEEVNRWCFYDLIKCGAID